MLIEFLCSRKLVPEARLYEASMNQTVVRHGSIRDEKGGMPLHDREA